MIRLRRPNAEEILDAATRSYLTRKTASVRLYSAGDPRIQSAWSGFLRTAARRNVEAALDAYSRKKCAYCEQIAAKDIEHFAPKTSYPGRMFSWDNFLKGCKNCNNLKVDRFPVDGSGDRLLIDPCADEPLDYFVWDNMTGATGITPDPARQPRASMTRDLFQLDQEPLREARRKTVLDVLYLLAQVFAENPVRADTRDRLRDHLQPHQPWLGLVRQLFLRSEGSMKSLVDQAQVKLLEIRGWIESWI